MPRLLNAAAAISRLGDQIKHGTEYSIQKVAMNTVSFGPQDDYFPIVQLIKWHFNSDKC